MMRRRKFLGLFGAASAAPFVPASVAAASTTQATYSAAALRAAIAHARSRAVFSVWGLARAVGVSAEQAEVLMGDLARKGVLGPLQGTTFGGRWASSRILQTEVMAARAALDQAKGKMNLLQSDADRFSDVDLSAFLAYLRNLAATPVARRTVLA